MKKIRNISCIILALFLVSLPLQVKSAETPAYLENETKHERTVEIVKVQDIDLGDYTDKMSVGEKQLLNVTVLPITANEVIISYTSSNPNIATVNGMGRITALAVGNTTIAVSSGQIVKSFELQVIEEENTNITVTDIEIAEHETEVEVGKSISISGTVLPSDATDSMIMYKSSDTSIATVSSTGEVKGISKGNVDIILTAGGVTKTVPITVKVSTAEITLNKDFLVLKVGETYQLSAKVLPEEANNEIIYSSTDNSIASVTSEGFVTAKGKGSAAIIVSNGDSMISASVIVNEVVKYEDNQETTEKEAIEDRVYAEQILASKQSIVDSEMLEHLYETKQVLMIQGDGYMIEIDGKDIVNYNNEFYTDIDLVRKKDMIRFVLNGGKELCGAITLYLEKPIGKYLYLYNNSKEKFEKINITNVKEIKLTSSGEYQLRTTCLKMNTINLLCIALFGVVILLIGIAIYIFIKKKYWFW